MVEKLMKKILLSIAIFSLWLLYGKSTDLTLENWHVLYAGKASFANGTLKAVPQNKGAALVRRILPGEVKGDFVHFRVKGTGFESGDLSLSLRGKTRVAVQKGEKQKDGSLLFAFPGLPENFSQLRLYFNSTGRLNKQAVEMQFTQLRFEGKPCFTADLSLRRKKMFEKTVIFPRIQSKYDLVKNYLSSYSAGTGTFVDRPLFYNRDLADSPLPEYDKQNSVKGFQKQLETARMFVDGLGLFYSQRSIRHLNPIRAAEAAGLKNCIFMEATPPLLKNTKLAFKVIDETLSSPAVFKHQGSLVISSYHGEVFKPEQWVKILKPFRQKYGKKVLFTIEMRAAGYGMNSHYRKTEGKPSAAFTEEIKARIRRYLDAADGVNFSASNHLNEKKTGFPENVLSIKAYREYIIPVFVSVLAEEKYNGKKIFGLSAHKGYTQTRRTASNLDDEGTGSMRKSLTAALEANCDYIVMPEWNEINENTHVEPLVSNALTNVRVVNALRNKTTSAVEKKFPDVILSFRQSNDLAVPIPIELLGLPEKDSGPSSVRLHLLSPEGKRIKSFDKVRFSHKQTEEKFYLEPAYKYGKFRYLLPELEISWKGKTFSLREGLPHIRLYSAPNVNNTYVKIPLRDLPQEGIQVKTVISGEKIQAHGKIRLPEKIMSVELLANENVLKAVDVHNEYRTPAGMVMLRWMRMTPVAHGFSNDRLTVRALKGRIRLRTPHIFSLTGMKLEQPSPDLISGRIGGGCCIREFFFFADPDAELEFSDRKERFKVTVASLIANGLFRQAGACGVSRTVEHCKEQIELPRPIGKKELSFSLEAPLRKDKNTVYSVRVVTEKGRVFRSRPVMAKSESAGQLTLPLRDILTDKVLRVTVPRQMIRHRIFDFSPRCGALLPLKDGDKEEFAVCGGFDYRSHSAKGWNVLRQPVWKKEKDRWVLDFVPGSGLLLCQPLFSRSAFDLRLEASFKDLRSQTLLDVLGQNLSVQVTDGRLHGRIVTTCGKAGWQVKEKLEKERFYKIRLTYDLETLRVYLDGKEAARQKITGTLPDAWILCIGGAPSGKGPAVSNVLTKAAGAHDTPDKAFRFNGTLRALEIANCPLDSN